MKKKAFYIMAALLMAVSVPNMAFAKETDMIHIDCEHQTIISEESLNGYKLITDELGQNVLVQVNDSEVSALATCFHSFAKDVPYSTRTSKSYTKDRDKVCYTATPWYLAHCTKCGSKGEIQGESYTKNHDFGFLSLTRSSCAECGIAK